jgi:hypothetical protein
VQAAGLKKLRDQDLKGRCQKNIKRKILP